MQLPDWAPIERVVAFVVAPIVTPLSGVLALWLSKHFPGVHVTGNAISAFAATTAAGVAASFFKWLDGRQKFTTLASSLAPEIHALTASQRDQIVKDAAELLRGEAVKLGNDISHEVPSPQEPIVTDSLEEPADPNLSPTNWPVAEATPPTTVA